MAVCKNCGVSYELIDEEYPDYCFECTPVPHIVCPDCGINWPLDSVAARYIEGYGHCTACYFEAQGLNNSFEEDLEEEY